MIARIALAGAALGLLAGAGPAGDGVTVSIKITELRSAKGVVRACMTGLVKDFPKCKQVPAHHNLVVPATGEPVISFRNVAPGRYAIAVLHDENNNGKVDRALLMMPKEGYGFSRDAKVVMGPPKFDAAAFAVGDEPLSMAIRMRYML